MDTSRERDQSVERLLRRPPATPPAAGPTDACLDAETVAAWTDGGLTGAQLEAALVHVADCHHCQALVGALARTEAAPHAAGAAAERPFRKWLPWLVPLTAAAAVLTLWVVVPERPREAATPAATSVAESAPVATAPAPATAPETQTPQLQQATQNAGDAARRAAQSPPQSPQSSELRADAPRLESERLKQESNAPAPTELSVRQAATPEAPAADALAERVAVAPPASAPAASAPPAAPASPSPPASSETRAPLAGPVATLGRTANIAAPGIVILSPDPRIRWRISGSALEYSSTGGASWAPVPTGVTAALTAGAAPSSTVCWVVGRGGTVLVSADGRMWQRVAFPENVDLTAVRATDARAASVSTGDGRTFSTTDAGASWQLAVGSGR